MTKSRLFCHFCHFGSQIVLYKGNTMVIGKLFIMDVFRDGAPCPGIKSKVNREISNKLPFPIFGGAKQKERLTNAHDRRIL